MAKIIAVVISAAMFAFSTWMYAQTGDWVALIFVVGSAGYGVLFASGQLEALKRRDKSEH